VTFRFYYESRKYIIGVGKMTAGRPGEVGGRKFKTLPEAKRYLKELNNSYTEIYKSRSKVYKYFVGTHIEWLNQE
jgi:hypothetical protein